MRHSAPCLAQFHAIAVAAAVLLLASTRPAPIFAEFGFTPVEPLVETLGDYGRLIQPAVAGDDSGRFICAFVNDGGPGQWDVVYYSIFDGVGWSSEAPLPRVFAGVNPSIDTDGQGRWVVLLNSVDPFLEWEIYAVRSEDNGMTWSGPVLVNSGGLTDAPRIQESKPVIRSDRAGHWLAIWHRVDTSTILSATADDLLYSISTDAGATWTPQAPIEIPADRFDSAADPSVAMDKRGNWVVVWRSNSPIAGLTGSDFDIHYTRTFDYGATWQSVLPLNPDAATDTTNDYQPDIDVSSDGVWLVNWQSYPMVQTMRSTDAGVTWTELPYSPFADLPRLVSLGGGRWLRESRNREVALSINDGVDWVQAPSDVTDRTFVVSAQSMGRVMQIGQGCSEFGTCPGAIKKINFRRMDAFPAEIAVSSSPNSGNGLVTNGVLAVKFRVVNEGLASWEPGRFHIQLVADPLQMFPEGIDAAINAQISPGYFFDFSYATQVIPPPEGMDLGFRFVDTRTSEFETFSVNVTPVEQPFTVTYSFPAGSNWTGAQILGDGLMGTNSRGFCMYAFEYGDNMMALISPTRLLPLVDKRVYRLRLLVETTQNLPDAIPLWDVTYDNYNPGGRGSTYGGAAWFLDVAGGANGIGRPQGRGSFDVYAAPNAMLTPQWRGTIGGGPPGSSGGAFTPQADPYNDMRLAFRALDFGSASINADADFGSVCLSALRVDAIDDEMFMPRAQLWGPPIDSSSHAAQTLAQEAEGAGLAYIIDEVAAVYQLTPSGPGSRKTLIPLDSSQEDRNASLYPVLWESDRIYRGVSLIQSVAGGWIGPEGSDPVDAIFLNFDTPTNELGAIHFTNRGSINNMLFAASPRLPQTTGGPQPYVAFFSGNNKTLSDLANSARLRLMTEFFNTSVIAPDGVGGDPLAVTGTMVESVEAPPALLTAAGSPAGGFQ